MSKFENNKTKQEEIEELKQKHIIQGVLGRKELEYEALIQAAQDRKNTTTEDIEKRKKEILRAKLEEEKQKNQEEINKKLKELEKAKKIAQEKEETEKRRKDMLESDRESFRKEIKTKEEKKAKVYQIGELYKREEKRKELNYVRTKENNAQKINFSKESRDIEEAKREKNGTIESIKEQLINLFKGNRAKQEKKTTNYKIIKGIKRYIENMNFYNQHTIEKINNQMNYNSERPGKQIKENNRKKQKDTVIEFKNIYNKVKIDHDLARKNAKKNKKEKSIQGERVS